MGKTVFITGTGTEVGKSALSLAVLAWAQERGLRAAYYKPVQCGEYPFGDPPVPHGDADWIRALLPKTPAHVTYRLRTPASPHLAAERDGRSIEPAVIRRDWQSLTAGYDLVVAEGAGGLAAPLDRKGLCLGHVAADLGLPCLLACAPGLGTLHHTLTTFAYLRTLGGTALGFAFSQRDPVVPEVYADNLLTLQTVTGMEFLGTLPHSPRLSLAQPLSPAEAGLLSAPLSPNLDRWWTRAAI